MRVPRNSCAALALLLGVVISHDAHAISFDAASDFSILSNPNGVWSYYAISGGTSSLLSDNTTLSTSSVNQWWNG
jgi:hypothetical protein